MATRDYGQDVILTSGKGTSKHKVSFAQKVRFYFDQSISKTPYFIAFLAAMCLFLALIITVLRHFITHPDESFLENWWASLTSLLEVGSDDETWLKRLLTLLTWIMSISIVATVIGFIGAGFESVITRLKGGRTPVIFDDHILILGWSNTVFSLLKELSVANENVRGATAVIFADKDNEEMTQELAANLPDKLGLRVVTRSGDTANPNELKLANPSGARSVLILNADEDDAAVVTTLMAVSTFLRGTGTSVVAEITDPDNEVNLPAIRGLEVIPVLAQHVITSVTAQSLRERGIGTVIIDFLDFDGDEIYFSAVPQLTGRTYAEALLSFEKSSIIGLAGADGSTVLNPASDRVIADGELVIAISEDDDTIVYSPVPAPEHEAVVREIPEDDRPRDILFIGWSEIGVEVLTQMHGFLPAGSRITVLYDPRYVSEDTLVPFEDFDVRYDPAGSSARITERAVLEGSFEQVVIIGYTDQLSESRADATTLLQMVTLDAIKGRNPGLDFRVVAELIDSSKATLAAATATEELVVSDNLTALLMAQLSENPGLLEVFRDIFDADGAALNMYPIEAYADLGAETTFADIVRAGIPHRQSVIGYRTAAGKGGHTTGVNLNPPKSRRLTPQAGDRVVVIDDVTDHDAASQAPA